jgi:hypothetical protein
MHAVCRMAPELFPSVPGGMSGMNRKEAEDRVTEKVRGSLCWDVHPAQPNWHAHCLQWGCETVVSCKRLCCGCDLDVTAVRVYSTVLSVHLLSVTTSP